MGAYGGAEAVVDRGSVYSLIPYMVVGVRSGMQKMGTPPLMSCTRRSGMAACVLSSRVNPRSGILVYTTFPFWECHPDQRSLWGPGSGHDEKDAGRMVRMPV